MANKGTKGKFVVGALQSTGDVTTATGNIIAAKAVSSGSQGFTMASVAFRVARIPVSGASAIEIDTGFDLPVGAVVKNVFLDVNVREQTGSSKLLDVGLLSTASGGNATGFLAAVSTASIQVVQGLLVAGSVTRGALLSEGTAASGRFRKDHVVKGIDATRVTYTPASVFTEFSGDIVIEFLAIA